MKEVLIGTIIDGKAGGIDRYMMNLFSKLQRNGANFDFCTNRICPDLQATLHEQGAELLETASLMHPLRQYRDFKCIFKNKQYDTAYFNLSTALGFIGPLAAKKCGVKKIVIHSHTTGCDISNPYKRKLMMLLHKVCRRFLYRFGTAFYACSEEAGVWLFPDSVVHGNAFQIVRNAIYTQNFIYDASLREKKRAELGLQDCFVIGHIGNFVYQKNHSFLLRAFEKVAQSDATARLLLVGDGVLFAQMQTEAENLNIQDKVLFVGRRTDANAYMQAMDVFAFPSNFEGLGIVAIEAQAAGLPCICSDRVPQEAHITDLCQYLPIDTDDAVTQWANVLLQAKNTPRTDRAAEIAAAGYDINSQNLEKLV